MIKILKSGSWALEGVNVVEMVAGTEGNFGSSENCKLVEAGWAEWAKSKAEAQKSAAEELRKPSKAK
jgi:hypothetical protein